MKWLTNMADPATHTPEADAWTAQGRAAFLRGKVIGEPRATATYTADQLREMGMVGVYAPAHPVGEPEPDEVDPDEPTPLADPEPDTGDPVATARGM